MTRVAPIRFVAGLALAVAVLAAGACGTVAVPAQLRAGEESCSSCRMTIGTSSSAAQLVAPHENPLFFDDLQCLADYLRAHRQLPAGTIAFVADHRTGDWIRARDAIFVRAETVETPMGSHALAFADTASRARDPVAVDAPLLDPDELFEVPLPNGEP